MAPLFQGLRFYLTHSLSREDKAELKQLIEENKGKVYTTPAGKMMQVVDSEMLDARHPDWISKEFIKESVALQTLQDSSQYSGQIFTTKAGDQSVKRKKRLKYTMEDDARMLHYAKVRRGWKSMQPIPESVWRIAQHDRVTGHSAQSMHEHFRKQLQQKTQIEQRLIMEEAAKMARARMKKQERTEEQKDQNVTAQARARSSPTGLRKIATPVSTTLANMHQQTPSSSDRLSRSTTPAISTSENRFRLVEEEKPSPRSKRSLLRRSQKDQNVTAQPRARSSPTGLRKIATPESTTVTNMRQQTPSSSDRRGDQSTASNQQKRRRCNRDGNYSERSTSYPEESNADCIENETRTSKGIFSRSDQTKRQMLQRDFNPPSKSPSENQASTANGVDVSTAPEVGEENREVRSASQLGEVVEQATDDEAEDYIYQLQLRTRQDMSAVVHAIFYCSGDVVMAESFLKGAVSSGMWSAEDDLLLMNLVAQEHINRSIVDAAVSRGDFTSMQVERDTDAILNRVLFLR